MTVNMNPKTGVRYGVISGYSIDRDVWDDLRFGPQAENLSEQLAAAQLREVLKARWQWAYELAEENYDGNTSALSRDDFISEFLQRRLKTAAVDTADEYADYAYERECDFGIDEPAIEGEYEGVKYQISWLGVPLLWVLNGPLGFANRLCSSCVPNAADLDGGFEPTNLALEIIHRDHDGYLCYVVPQGWLAAPKAD